MIQYMSSLRPLYFRISFIETCVIFLMHIHLLPSTMEVNLICNIMGSTLGFMNSMYPNYRMYGQYGNPMRSGLDYVSNGYDSRTDRRRWLAVDSKYKPRGRGNGFFGYGNANVDGLNENFFAPIALGHNILSNGSNYEDKDKSNVIPDKEQCHLADFPQNYSEAKLFIIKSYSEDDIHKSIKYSVWASIPNGNKKLDAG
ncbi:hypothetical protein HHK36_019584 [Tetracentron sinense]|uniref:YTH domain-containing family protein n=1 Tax=Tetracentron sinense TaxID=13715 RepID=A0A834YTY9_TETSI|nr:hypothetical protein HHK36_019584 [Tetracentron sinense]